MPSTGARILFFTLFGLYVLRFTLCDVIFKDEDYKLIDASAKPSGREPISEDNQIVSTADETADVGFRLSRGYERRANRNCPSLRNALPNGWVKVRGSSSRISRFQCNPGFDLVGNRYTTCINGKWNRDVPVCVSSGCERIVSQGPLKVKKLIQGSVLDLSCELGYFLNVNITNKPTTNQRDLSGGAGLQKLSAYPNAITRLYCVSKTWRIDDPFTTVLTDTGGIITRIPILSQPVCEVFDEPANKSMSCDFEDTLCGWFQDTEDNFDWQRNRHSTPSSGDGTGPDFDHTLGQNKSGYYLYLESSYPRSPNEVARLYSPVYQHLNDIHDACFEFYYHMYGKAIGSLRVYILFKSQVLLELTPRWEMVGEQGNVWSKAQIEINSGSEDMKPFQIVIEGILGHGHQGDIAIDDLKLTLGENCTNYNNTSEIDPETVSEINAINAETTPASTLRNSSSTTEAPRAEGFYSSTSAVSLTSSLPAFLNRNVTTTTSSTLSSTVKPKNGTSTFINQIQRIAEMLAKGKKSSTTTTTQSSLSTVPAAFSNPTSKTTTNATQITVSTSTVATSSSSSSPCTDMSDIACWNGLHKKLNDTTRKLANELTELRKSTTPVGIESSSSTTPASVPPTDKPGSLVLPKEGLNVDHETLLNETFIKPNPAKSSRLFGSSVALTAIALICLVVIVASTLYIAYVYRPAKSLDRANLDHFVASFVRRCKTGFRAEDAADDAELLMVGARTGMMAHDGVEVESQQQQLSNNSSTDHFDPNHNSDLLAYDNAHMTDGVVYLQPTFHQRY